MHYEVKNGQRTIEFDGEKLSSSSSRSEKPRWVEFNLYLTAGGSYVLERIGYSLIYHDIGCSVVDRSGLKFRPEDQVGPEHVPCIECDPDPGDPEDIIVIEKPRYFGLWSETPDAVLESLYGNRNYMTKVAERLIEDAAQYDQRLERAYRIEHVK
jgi:hypothetical protein